MNSDENDPNSIDKIVRQAYSDRERRIQEAQKAQQQQRTRMPQQHLVTAGTPAAAGEPPKLSPEEETLVRELNALFAGGKDVKLEGLKAVLKKAGASLDDYGVCPQCINKGLNEGIYYTSEGKPPVRPELIPSGFLMRFVAEMWPCTGHRAPMELAIPTARAYKVSTQTIDWLIIELGKELQKPTELNVAAEQQKLPYRIVQYTETWQKKGTLVKRERQALVFLDKTAYLTQEAKELVLRQLRGEVIAEAAAQPQQPMYAQPIQQQSATQAPTNEQATIPKIINGMLPQGALEVLVAQITANVTYQGEPYTFQSRTALLNGLLAIT